MQHTAVADLNDNQLVLKTVLLEPEMVRYLISLSTIHIA